MRIKKHPHLSLTLALLVLGSAAPRLAGTQEPAPVPQPQGEAVASGSVPENPEARPKKKRLDLDKAGPKSLATSKKKKRPRKINRSSHAGTEGSQTEVTDQTEVSNQADRKK